MDLKPCPFCGGKAGFYNFADDTFVDFRSDDDCDEGWDCWSAKCRDCGAQSSRADNLPSKALDEWNTRKPEDLAAEKRRFEERLFFALLEKRGNGSNDLRSIESLIERSKRATEHFFGGE